MNVKLEESNDTPTDEINCSLKTSIDSFVEELKCKIELINQDAKTKYEDMLKDQDEKHQKQLDTYQVEIDSLKNQVTDTKIMLGNHKKRLASRNQFISRVHQLKSLSKINGCSPFQIWRNTVTSNIENKYVCRLSAFDYKKKLMRKYFARLTKFVTKVIQEKKKEINESRLEAITTEIITRYEAEIDQVRSELHEQKQLLLREKLSRQQLEDSMRRTLMQGMTAMNVGALYSMNNNNNQDTKD